MTQLVSLNQDKTITSIEIAEITDKSHSHVMRDIRKIEPVYCSEFNAPNFGLVDYLDKKGETRQEYKLNKLV